MKKAVSYLKNLEGCQGNLTSQNNLGKDKYERLKFLALKTLSKFAAGHLEFWGLNANWCCRIGSAEQVPHIKGGIV